MRRGKEIAQGSHASGEFLWELLGVSSSKQTETLNMLSILEILGSWVNVLQGKNSRNIRVKRLIEWRETGMTKITCRVNSEDELLEIEKKAKDAKIDCYMITDSGRTEFDGVATRTCLSLGPDTCEKIDNITGGLKLY